MYYYGGIADLHDKKDIMAAEKTQLEFGAMKPVLVSGSQGLNATGVGKSFNKRRVVRNVSLELQRGEAVGLLGPNGAGKTTTFYMLLSRKNKYIFFHN